MKEANILGRYSIKHILLELCSPILMKEPYVHLEKETYVYLEIPPKYKYIRNLIPVVLDLHTVQYTCWSRIFRDAACSKNLLHHIDPTVPPPLPDINISSDDYTYLWCKQDAVVLSWIYGTISPYLLHRLLNENRKSNTTSAMEAWARLRDISQQHYLSVQRKKRKFIHIDLNEHYRSPGDDINDDCVDMLSNLPDHLLVYILSLVDDLKTAGRTSILSKRWTLLWSDLVDLDFSDLETTATLEYHMYTQPEMNKFVDWVNQVTAANRAPNLRTFIIHFPLNSSYAAHIENWLEFALVKNVRHLELKILPSYISRIPFLKIFSNNPASILNTTLESLHLKGVSIERPFIQWVITNCLNLQRLSLHKCFASAGASSKHRLKLLISSLKLKHLELSNCLTYLKIDALHLSTPNLTSFIYNESEIDVEYHSVPSLVDVTFGGSYFHHLKAVSGFSSQLEKLSIVWDEENRPHCLFPINSRLPTFANVQQLEIISSQQYRLSAASLMEACDACPLMHTFKLKLMCRKQLEGPWNSLVADKAEYKIMWHLKTVEYLGYAGCTSASELALYFTRLAPMLQTFMLDTRQPQFVGKPLEAYTSDQMEIVKSKTELLAERIRTSRGHVNVVILLPSGNASLGDTINQALITARLTLTWKFPSGTSSLGDTINQALITVRPTLTWKRRHATYRQEYCLMSESLDSFRGIIFRGSNHIAQGSTKMPYYAHKKTIWNINININGFM